MTSSLIVRVILVWILFLPLAVTNGAVRDFFYKPKVGDLAAHQISTVIASLAFVFLSYLMVDGLLADVGNWELFLVGFGWVIVTMIFEFGMGIFISKLPMEKILADYNILAGRVWALFLLTELLTPFILKFVI